MHLTPTRECETEALIDTGATYLAIPASLVQKLGLWLRSQQKAKYAVDVLGAASRRVGREGILEEVTEPLLIECACRQTTEDALVTGDIVLIG